MKRYKQYFQPVLAEYVKTYRIVQGYTQEDMADRLHIDVRSYSDLDQGIYCCSAVTLILFLLMLSDEEIIQLIGCLRSAKQCAEKNMEENQAVGV